MPISWVAIPCLIIVMFVLLMIFSQHRHQTRTRIYEPKVHIEDNWKEE